MLLLTLLVLLVPFSTSLTLEEIWHKKWLKTKLTTTPSPLYHPGIVQHRHWHRSKQGKQTKEVKTRKESTTITTRTASETFCSTAGCVRAASELLQKMDQTVDPCQVLVIFFLSLASSSFCIISVTLTLQFFLFTLYSLELTGCFQFLLLKGLNET